MWFLVAPQNPLKQARGMDRFEARLHSAQTLAAGDPRLIATGIERRLGTRFTVQTLALLRRRFPRARFVWLMGADNLVQLPRWQGWTRILGLVPVAVHPRPGSTRVALSSLAAKRFRSARLPARATHALPVRATPAWTMLEGPELALSATAIRESRGASKRPAPAAAEVPAAPTRKGDPAAPPRGSDPAAPPRKAEPRARRKEPRLPPPRIETLVELARASLDDDKAEDVVVIDLEGKASFADRMIVATGLAGRQIDAMASHLLDRFSKAGVRRVKVEGSDDWVLIDAGDLIVHLFKPEARAAYGIEKMWGAALG